MSIVGQGGKIILFMLPSLIAALWVHAIYSSVTFFVLPAVALMTLTWVYFVPAVFLYGGVMIFIGTEEKQLTQAFGKEYEDYLARVDRLVPFRKP
ncbi:MAG: hypothetical protein P8Y14_26170 [Anaerolineales bacterium]